MKKLTYEELVEDTKYFVDRLIVKDMPETAYVETLDRLTWNLQELKKLHINKEKFSDE